LADRASDESGFFIVRPKPNLWDSTKAQGRGDKYDHDKYEEDKEEVRKRKLDEQIRAVTSSIKSKPIRDIDNFYFVIEATRDATFGGLYSALRRLKATVHAYLDKDHRILLVSSPAGILSRFQRQELPLAIKNPILRIRELRRSEQISTSLDSAWEKGHISVIVHIMPNENVTTLEKYLAAIRAFLRERDSQVIWLPTPDQGMLTTQIDKRVGDELIDLTNYVFNIHMLPKGVQSVDFKSRKPRGTLGPRGRTSSLEQPPKVSESSLPEVCVVDSGVNQIKQLASLITERSAVEEFKGNLEDEGKNGGHGTPIAYLVAMGEGEPYPRARIISYKVFSESNDEVAYKGMIEAIQTYRSRTKVFVSSINFEDDDALSSYAKLDDLIQESNVCFVNSAGNLTMAQVKANSAGYPTYIPKFHLLHPAQNTLVTGVGAIAGAGNDYTIAGKNGLSPFTRCGKSLGRLYDVSKPDAVDNGGNLTKAFESSGIGVPTYRKDGSFSDELTGTSFSAPLIAGRLVEIVAKFGGNHNAEFYKAIMFMSCSGPRSGCFGQGVPRKLQEPDYREAIFVAEGSIPLSNTLDTGVEHVYADRVSIPVPEGVRRIEMCLVHSDDFYDDDEPSLDTFLRVNARKEGRPSGRVEAESDKEVQNKRSYIKYLVWKYKKRDMGATWNFDIIPETTKDIDPLKRTKTNVRYGCAIRITSSRPEVYPLAHLVRQMMKQWEGARVA
jgi:hypothetical protein